MAQITLVSSRSASGVFDDGGKQINTLFSWHVKESAGVAAVANLRRKDATGTILLPLYIPANGAFGDGFDSPPVADGWYLEIVSGTVVFSIAGM